MSAGERITIEQFRALARRGRVRSRHAPPRTARTYDIPEQAARAGLPAPESEVRFCERKWRFDFAWPDALVALEVEGGIWQQGRHTRGTGYTADMEKYNAAQLLGWMVLRVTPEQATSGVAISLVRQALIARTAG